MNVKIEKTQEELNLELYSKLTDELEKYKEELLSMSSAELLEHAYKFAGVKHRMMLYFGCNDLEANEAEVLLKAENTLDILFDAWENGGEQYMDILGDVIMEKASAMVREAQDQNVKKGKARDREER